MRDLIIVALVAAGSLAALRRPWIGVMVWTWLSIMNPHRYSFGFAYDAPLAALAAGCTILGALFTKERASPLKGAPTLWLLAFIAWITVSWMLGLDMADDKEQWSKVMKIFFMTLMALALLHSKAHVYALIWVAAGSLAILGMKGGFFTIATGGGYRVWGPPGSFIEDNNEFALSLVMTIPLLRFLQMSQTSRLMRHGLTLAMVLCAAAALGTQSRGALLAISTMGIVMWWRGKSRLLGGVVMAAAAVALVAFMPDSWTNRMNTISSYEEDRSAMGRISAWWTAWGIAKNYVFGVGFNAARPELFAAYSPHPDYVHAAHSIYFQVLGNHGFGGLFIFLGIFASTYWYAGRLRKEAAGIPEAEWCDRLGAMCQVSLIGYAVGGAFLSLSYFDLPYDVMIAVVVARQWVSKRAWQTEPAPKRRWFQIPGLVDHRPASPSR